MHKSDWNSGTVAGRSLRDAAEVDDDLESNAIIASPKSSYNASKESLLDKDARQPKRPTVLEEALPIRRKRYLLILMTLVPLISLTAVGLMSSGSQTISPTFTGDYDSFILPQDDAALLQEEMLAKLAEQGWRAFDATLSSPIQARRRIRRPLQAQRSTSQACVDQWIAKGELCEEYRNQTTALTDSEFDVLWTWVAENPFWLAWRNDFWAKPNRVKRWLGQLSKRLWMSGGSGRKSPPAGTNAYGVKNAYGASRPVSTGNKEKHFRSHHEFRYSQRSVLAALPDFRKLHLLTTDLPLCEPSAKNCQESDVQRVGETPIWLNPNKVANGQRYGLQYHWNLFKSDNRDADSWRRQNLPVYNSLAIESQLPNVADMTDYGFYLNDDVYVLRSLASADIVTPLFGPVFRIQKDLHVDGAAPGESRDLPDGEWPGMKYSNWLLDNRFGSRSRSYLVHIGKTIIGPLLDEIASIWAEELASTAGIRFRGRGGTEVNMLFLSTYYTIERHREALLWSFFVARSDSKGDGIYSLDDRRRLIAAFDGKFSERYQAAIKVYRPSRALSGDVQPRQLLTSAHLSTPKETDYLFTSMDGYPLVDLKQPVSDWPRYNKTAMPAALFPSHVCDINIYECFGSLDFSSPSFKGDSSSQSLFKRMAFEKPQCGDCAIVALLAQSGDKGLEAFLPKIEASNFTYAEDTRTTPPPMLGDLDKSWQKTDFSLSALYRESAWSRREYAVRLLQRYSYAIGDTATRFISLRSINQIKSQLNDLHKSLEQTHGPRSLETCIQAIVALNDDIAGDKYMTAIDTAIDEWHDKMWPNKTEFEL